jgi:hypothetical protein
MTKSPSMLDLAIPRSTGNAITASAAGGDVAGTRELAAAARLDVRDDRLGLSHFIADNSTITFP